MLTARTRLAIRALFADTLWARVERTLTDECTPQAVHAADFTTCDMERIWLAALASSGGDLSRLDAAVLLAQTDWRDLLVGAGFGSDGSAHLRWTPSRTARGN